VELDRALAQLKERAREFARLAPAAKASLLRQCVARLAELAPAWVAEGSKAKGIQPDQVPEEWLAGPAVTARITRLTAQALEAIAARGRPPLGTGTRQCENGRLEADVFPGSAFDRILYGGLRGSVIFEEGIDREAAIARQAEFYQRSEPDGGVSLILGAGNVSSIPPLDAIYKMFAEGFVCLVKMSPVNQWVGPYLERAFDPLISRGFLRIAYGGGEVGRHLVGHPGIDDVHITGSDRTHDMIVWGPPGPERERRMTAGEPVLKVPISSELGNVSPVAIVPYAYGEAELRFQARNLATMVANNASFNCNAAKMLITSRDWPQRERFLELLVEHLAGIPTRQAYYPGAFDRHAALTEGRRVEKIGQPREGHLPWTLIRDVDATRSDDPIFRDEPFCAILSETTVGSADPVEFMTSATRFMNDTLWGTLNACIVIPPALEKDATVGRALDRAIGELRYGTIGINQWPAVAYGLGQLPWGGHPSARLEDIQSGLGWVHNSFFLGGIEKVVLRGPIRMRPTPIWFYDNPKTVRVAPHAVAFEASPRWLGLPGLIARAL
jgi:acyl-CoA reductase-like NAD-dependent aldehyde dehydrogenase